MASREHSGVHASLPPVDADEAGAGGEGGLAASDGLACFKGRRPAGRPAATPRTANGCHAPASLCEGALAYTRRAVLGAAVAVPVVQAGGCVPLPEPCGAGSSPGRVLAAPHPLEGEGQWGSTLRALRQAEAAVAAFERWAATPAWRSFEEREALNDAYGERVSAFDAAMLALLEAPAPDLEALAVKIALIAKHRVWELDGGEECLAWLEADARRLVTG